MSGSHIADRVGHGLTVARRARGWTVAHAAALVGWPAEKLARLEQGAGSLDPGDEHKLIRLYGLDPSTARAIERLIAAG
jgi:hypothetical protein